MIEPALPHDEDERISSLHALGILDTPPEERFDRITRLTSLVFDVPIAVVSLVDVNRQWFKSCVGLDVSETARSVSFCGHAILLDEALVVNDALSDVRFRDNPLVTGEPRIRFYAGQPLRDKAGKKLGTLCIIDREPREFGAHDRRILAELGARAEEELGSVGLERAIVALEESRMRLAAVTESMVDGLVTTTPSGAILSFNAAAEQIFGWSRDEVLGRHFDVLTTTVVDVDVDDLARTQSSLGPFEVDGVRKDGTRFALDVTVSATTLAGEVLLIRTVRDVTQSRETRSALCESEERHRTLVAALSEGVLLCAADGTIAASNEAATRILGLSEPDLRGKKLVDLPLRPIRPDLSELPVAEHPAFVTSLTGQPCTNAILGVHQPSGDLRWVSMNTQPLRLTNDVGPWSIAVSFADVSEGLAIERMKNEFVSIVSHELRTPLTSIRGALGLLAAGTFGSVSGEAQRMIEIAVSNTDRLIRLINDILDVEKMEAGGIALSVSECEVEDILQRAVDVMNPMGAAAGVRLEAEASSALVVADGDRIVQTITNLLSNAIKFSPRDGTVRVSARVDGEQTVFSVADEGPGIPPDKLQQVFDRFWQVDATNARERSGSGLGLAICKSIVEEHAGRIWAESELGGGTTVRFTLPNRAQSGNADPDERTPATNRTSSGGDDRGSDPHRGARVLLVEDDA